MLTCPASGVWGAATFGTALRTWQDRSTRRTTAGIRRQEERAYLPVNIPIPE